ncbi:MAG TPA: ATP synthase F0 subunit B [Myxococcaceae bacterium]|nr:ATP synthase F0 subunit B [Myxococcaceae bacterium]
MAPVLAVMWIWKVALGGLGVAALVWLVLASFVATRWPALHPWLGKLRTPAARMALVGTLVVLVVGAAFVSRSAYARGRAGQERDEFGRRRAERRLVLLGSPERQVMIRTVGRGMPRLTMVHVGGPCTHVQVNAGEGEDAEVDTDAEEAVREAEQEAREAEQEAYADAEEQAREAQQEARERAQEARERAQERVQEARDRAQERAQEARERAMERAQQAQERAQEARERAQEIAQREMERAQAVMEQMGDEMDTTRDAVQEGFNDEDGDHGRSRSQMESFLERQAEKVERLGHEMADKLRGLANRFDDDDGDQDRDDDRDEDELDL